MPETLNRVGGLLGNLKWIGSQVQFSLALTVLLSWAIVGTSQAHEAASVGPGPVVFRPWEWMSNGSIVRGHGLGASAMDITFGEAGSETIRRIDCLSGSMQLTAVLCCGTGCS